MKKKFKKKIAAGAAIVAAFAGVYFLLSLEAAQTSARWYSPVQVNAGEKLYAANCLSCHGVRGAGDANWRKRDEAGAYPPPPLNGSAHTWHHSLAVLRRTIDRGGAELGGKMPAFAAELNAEERDAIIAYFQSLWSDEIYKIWSERVQKNAAH